MQAEKKSIIYCMVDLQYGEKAGVHNHIHVKSASHFLWYHKI